MRRVHGEPFTTDDITFAYDDIRNYPDLVSPTPGWLSNGFRRLGGHVWGSVRPLPNVGVPTLTARMTERELGDGGRFVVVRNPYYWKTDPDGSQLPYLDRVVDDVVNDTEMMILKISNGEIDMHCRHVNIPANKPVLARSRAEGDHDFFEIETTDTNQMAIHLNLTTPDPVLREVFNIKEFRIGLSHAINRQEIIDAVFQRRGEPWQIAPRPESPFFDEKFARQYLEYEPNLPATSSTVPDSTGAMMRASGCARTVSRPRSRSRSPPRRSPTAGSPLWRPCGSTGSTSVLAPASNPRTGRCSGRK